MTSDPAVAEPSAAVIPRSSWIALAAEPASAAIARRFAHDVLSGQVTDPDHAYVVALLVSELVTNALRAAARVQAAGRPIRLGVAPAGRWTRIAVTDPDLDPPVPRAAAPDDVSGRGLAIVDAYAALPFWTTYGDGAKTVHAVIPVSGVTLTDAEVAYLRSTT